jgi:hypothetical protein
MNQEARAASPQFAKQDTSSRRQSRSKRRRPKLKMVTRVAVGTLVSQRPPLRSVRAGLPHTALALDYDAYLGFGCG